MSLTTKYIETNVAISLKMWTYLALALLLMSVNQGVSNGCKYKIQHNVVDLSSCGLKHIPDNIPVNTEVLLLRRNEISDVPDDTFVNLTEITFLDLSNNKIWRIHVNSFKGLTNIVHLDLSTNNLTANSFAVNSFLYLSNIQELFIHNNPDFGDDHIAYSDELYRMQHLKKLSLDSSDSIARKFNRFRCFKDLQSLWLRYKSHGHNQMTITNTTFRDLQDIPIQELHVSVLSVEIDSLVYFPKLNILTFYLTWNSIHIDKMFKSLGTFQERNMTRINISYNPSQFVLGREHLKYVWNICLSELYLQHDTIINIDPSSFYNFARKSKCLEILDLSNNPISTTGVSWVVFVALFQNLRIAKFSHTGLHNRRLKSSIIGTPSVNISLPSTLEELYCTNVETSDGLSKITLINGQHLQILDLSYFYIKDCLGSFHGIKNLVRLDISGFNCGYLNSKMISHLPMLESFTSQHSYLGTSFKTSANVSKMFRGLYHISHIDLSWNNFDSLPASIFEDQQESLTHLNLANNHFKNVPMVVTAFAKLKCLDLRSNEIYSLGNTQMKMLQKTKNVEILFSGNPIRCTCKEVKFLRWIKLQDISFFNSLPCKDEQNREHNISNIINTLKSFEVNCDSKFWLSFSVTMTTVCGLILLLTVMYYRYRFVLQYTFLKLRMRMKRYTTLNQFDNFEFDAFISYSHHDSSWMREFQGKLTDMGFNLCFDAKTFIAGDLIAENIIRAIDNSRKIIFIITRNFLESTWGGYELEMTRMHAFREDRDNMVIIIMKEDIPIEEMPRVLKQIWYKVTCIQFVEQDEAMFYDAVASSLQ